MNFTVLKSCGFTDMRGNSSYTDIGKLELFKPTVSCFPNVAIKLLTPLM